MTVEKKYNLPSLTELDVVHEDVHSPTVRRGSPENSHGESLDPVPVLRATSSLVSEIGLMKSEASIVHPSRVKLLKLTLKKFTGDLTTWTTFWDSFESAVHNNSDLSSIDKFNYLHSLLERAAVDAISGLTLMAANYDEAIAILKKRFGNKQQIINKHMDILINLEVVTAYNLKGLRNLFDKIETQVRGLKSLGVPFSTYGNLLSSILMTKLPHDLRLFVSRRVSDDDWDLDSLMRILDEEIGARERAATMLTPNPTCRRQGKDSATAAVLMTGCAYCGHDHPSSLCRTVADTNSRKQILQKSGRCFVCLRKCHIGRDCRSNQKCTICHGQHHTSIYQRGVSRTRDTRNPSAQTPSVPSAAGQSVTSVSQGTTPQSPVPSQTNSTCMCNNVWTPVLFQTARAMVFRPDRPEFPVEVRILFDSGSQRSYLTN